MLTIAASELQFYQKKIFKLQMEVITLQQELLNAKANYMDQYKIKYELLLEKLAQQKQLKQSQRSESILQQEKSVNQINSKWETTLNQRIAQFNIQIQALSQDKVNLRNKVVELEIKIIKLQKDIDEGDSQILKIKLETIKKQNERLRKENNDLYRNRQEIIHEMKAETESKIQSVKQRQKGFYRDQIQALQKKIEEMQVVLESQRKKISPQRQQLIHSLQREILSIKAAQDQELSKLAQLLQKRNQQFSIYREQAQRIRQSDLDLIRDLTKQVKFLQEKLFNYNYDKQIQLKYLQSQMSKKRQNQANDLKHELQSITASFQQERLSWKKLVDQAQQNQVLVKRDAQQQKRKFIQEKKALKEKIQDLKAIIKQRQDQRAKGESQNNMKSLRDFNSSEAKYSTYENAITFMDRQVRKSAMKIQQKNRQINNLLEELKTLQNESEQEVKQVKQKLKQEQIKLYDKIFALEEQLDSANQALKEKDKYIKRKQADLLEEQEGHQSEVENLKKIIQEMQRDYKRITGNKKNIQDSYREQRQNVISGKLDINQQKKKKWVQLVRQRNQLEIVYRERQMQLKGEFQTQIDKLKREKQRYAQEREEYRAQVELLRDRLNEGTQNKQNKAVQYQKKLATLDLEIALTQTLFNTLSNATSKKKSELQQLSENQSSSQSFEVRVTDVMTPPFTSVDMPKQQIYKGATYSFTPYTNNK